MNNRTLDRPKALEGLRPAFSAHVRWCEHGAPVQCAVARTVHCSLNLPQAGRLLLMNNRTLDRPKALEGLRPAFSAHVSWCEHGAPIECAAAGTVHCSLNLPQASQLLGMTRGGRRFHWGLVIGMRDDRGERDASMESGRRTEGDFHPLGWAAGPRPLRSR
jgi:hypothetical protein